MKNLLLSTTHVSGVLLIAATAGAQDDFRTHSGPGLGNGLFGHAIENIRDIDGDGVDDYAISGYWIDHGGNGGGGAVAADVADVAR